MKFKSLTGFVVLLLALTLTYPALAYDKLRAAKNLVSEVEGMIPKNVPEDRISIWYSKNGDEPERVLATLYRRVPSGGFIHVAIYSLTHPVIVKALTDAKHRGVDVRVIVDSGQLRQRNMKVAVSTLEIAGTPVKTNAFHGLMHMKISNVNREYVTTGSYNYTTSASKYNEECLYVIPARIDAGGIKKSEEKFLRMWQSVDYRIVN